MSYSIAQIQDLLRQAGWPENLVEKMSAIVMYESSGNPNSHNPNGEDSWGLLQVNWPYHKEYSRSRLTEPLYNLQAAYAIYRKEGLNAWYNSNVKYRNNLYGIATKAKQIYSGITATPVINSLVTNSLPQQSTTSNEGNLMLYGALGLLAIVLIRGV